jgi:hypothetical protein
MKRSVFGLALWMGFFLFSPTAEATHYLGSEITYEHLSGCTYRIYVTEYFDCSGIVAPPSVPSGGLSFLQTSGGCLSNQPTAINNWMVASDTEVTPFEGYFNTSAPCGSGGPLYRVRQLVFYRDYDFCNVTCPVRLSSSGCCRNGGVINLVSPSASSYAVHSEMLDPAANNSSPVWLDPSFAILDIGQKHRISLAASDPDGDSLVYSLEGLFTANGVPVNYNLGYSATSPLGPGVGISINPKTGDLSLPNTLTLPLGTYSIGVSVTEYRNGTPLGKYHRDFSAMAILGINGPGGTHPEPYIAPFGGNYPNPVGATYIDSFTVQAFQGVNLQLPIELLYPAPMGTDSFEISWSQNLPGSAFANHKNGFFMLSVKDTFPVARLHWTPQQAGQYAFNVKLEDTAKEVLSIADHSFLIVVEPCDLAVEVGMPGIDTFTICAGDSLTLNASVTGGTGPYAYFWDMTGDTTASSTYAAPGWYAVEAVGLNGCHSVDTFKIQFADACVWPGDADNDGTANNNDLLALGLTYGNTGPLRPNANLSWAAQQAINWNDTLPNGVNAVYCDTDGNGIVNDDDTLAISLNYGLTHMKGQSSLGAAGDPPLFLQAPDTVLVGDTVVMPLIFGLDSNLATDIYGMALTVQYDPMLVDSGSAHFQYNGWLGNYGNNLLGLQKDHYANGEIDLALTRTDLQNMSGYGAVANFSIVMIDDIAGKTEVSETLSLEIVKVRIIRVDGSEVLVDPQGSQIVLTKPSSTRLEDGLGKSLTIYPQPAQDQVFLEMDRPQAWEATLYNLDGKVLRSTRTFQDSRIALSLEGLSPGMYLVRVSSERGQAVRKVLVRR